MGAHNSVVGADQGFRAPSGDQESVRDSVHEDSASAPHRGRSTTTAEFPALTGSRYRSDGSALEGHTATCLSGAPVCDSMTCHTELP